MGRFTTIALLCFTLALVARMNASLCPGCIPAIIIQECPTNFQAIFDCSLCEMSCQAVAPGCPNIQAGACGDPHFIGFQGERYDFQGQPNKYFNILTDDHVQVNAHFTPKCGDWYSYMNAFGIKLHSHRILVNLTGAWLDEEALTESTTLVDIDTTLKVNGTKVNVITPDYIFHMFESPGTCKHLDLEAKIVDRSRVKPHGLLGQSNQHDHSKNKYQIYGPNAEGEIEGTSKDYEVTDLFADDFTFNKFSL